jgi:hypothetical protein
MEIIIHRDEESYVINTPVDIKDDDNNELTCVVETRITSVGGMPITDREIIWGDREPADRTDVERKILEKVKVNRVSRL